MAGWGRCRSCKQRIWFGTSPFNSAKLFPFDDSDEKLLHYLSCSAQEWATDLSGQRHTVEKCRACGKRVWWQTTRTGKHRPMDCNGNQASWECHFDTCAGEPVGASNGRAAPPRPPTLLDPRDAVAMYLDTLGLSWPCTLSEARSAFRSLAMVHHPDMGGQGSEFIKLRLAYERLKELLAA